MCHVIYMTWHCIPPAAACHGNSAVNYISYCQQWKEEFRCRRVNWNLHPDAKQAKKLPWALIHLKLRDKTVLTTNPPCQPLYIYCFSPSYFKMEELSFQETQQLAKFLSLSYNMGFYFQTQLDSQLILCHAITTRGLLLESSLCCQTPLVWPTCNQNPLYFMCDLCIQLWNDFYKPFMNPTNIYILGCIVVQSIYPSLRNYGS